MEDADVRWSMPAAGGVVLGDAVAASSVSFQWHDLAAPTCHASTLKPGAFLPSVSHTSHTVWNAHFTLR